MEEIRLGSSPAVPMRLECALRRSAPRPRSSATLWTLSLELSRAPLSGILQARTLQWGAMPSPGGLLDPGIEPTSRCISCVAGGIFTAESRALLSYLIGRRKRQTRLEPFSNFVMFEEDMFQKLNFRRVIMVDVISWLLLTKAIDVCHILEL